MSGSSRCESTSRPAALIVARVQAGRLGRPRRGRPHADHGVVPRRPSARSHRRSSALEGGQRPPGRPVLRRPDDEPAARGWRGAGRGSWARRSAARDSSGRSSRSVRGEPVTQIVGRDGDAAARPHRLCLTLGRGRDDDAGEVEVVQTPGCGAVRSPSGPTRRRSRRRTATRRAAAQRRRTGAAAPDSGCGMSARGPSVTKMVRGAEQVPLDPCVAVGTAVTLAPPRPGSPARTISTFLIVGSRRTASNTARALPSSRWRARIHGEGPPVVEPRRPALVARRSCRRSAPRRHGDRAVGPACGSPRAHGAGCTAARRARGSRSIASTSAPGGSRQHPLLPLLRGRARGTGSRAGTAA